MVCLALGLLKKLLSCLGGFGHVGVFYLSVTYTSVLLCKLDISLLFIKRQDLVLRLLIHISNHTDVFST